MHLLKLVPRRAAGALLSLSDSGEWEQQADTLQCVHCQRHWVASPGSGIQRGWCFQCHGPSCGRKVCTEVCIPWEQALEAWEGSRALTGALARIQEL